MVHTVRGQGTHPWQTDNSWKCTPTERSQAGARWVPSPKLGRYNDRLSQSQVLHCTSTTLRDETGGRARAQAARLLHTSMHGDMTDHVPGRPPAQGLYSQGRAAPCCWPPFDSHRLHDQAWAEADPYACLARGDTLPPPFQKNTPTNSTLRSANNPGARATGSQRYQLQSMVTKGGTG